LTYFPVNMKADTEDCKAWLRLPRLPADARRQRHGHRALREGRPADGVHPVPGRAARGV